MKTLFLLFTFVFFMTFLHAEEISYQMIELNPPDSLASVATDINERGQVVGLYLKKEDVNQLLFVEGYPTLSVFLWHEESGFQYLGKSVTEPKINNLGHVVGSKIKSVYGFAIRYPFIWRPDTGEENIEEIKGMFNIASWYPRSINDNDQLLLTSHVDNSKFSSEAQNVWVWHEGEYEKVGDLKEAEHLSNEQIISGLTKVSYGWFGKRTIPLQIDFLNHFTIPIPLENEKMIGSLLMTNAQGDALGTLKYLDTKKEKGFLWNASEGIEVMPEGFVPISLNNHRQVTGLYGEDQELCLYEGRKLKKIGFMLGKSKKFNLPWLSAPHISKIFRMSKFKPLAKINDRGQMVGYMDVRTDYNSTELRAFIIEPKK